GPPVHAVPDAGFGRFGGDGLGGEKRGSGRGGGGHLVEGDPSQVEGAGSEPLSPPRFWTPNRPRGASFPPRRPPPPVGSSGRAAAALKAAPARLRVLLEGRP